MAGRPFGITTRFGSHAGSFDLVFFEAKGISGAFREAPLGTVPSISAFADEKVARDHPNWVQVGPTGERAERGGVYFDWSCLCPTRPEVFDLALDWARRAGTGGCGLRLDDVAYAREGYCACPICVDESRKSGAKLATFHQERITDFVRQVRRLISGPVYVTVHPDPYPGHLEENYGVDLDRLGGIVDGFVVPVYDMAYTTTYWIEGIASGFRDRLRKPFLVELYGLDVDEERVVKAAQVASHYAWGVLVAYDRDLKRLKRIRDALAEG